MPKRDLRCWSWLYLIDLEFKFVVCHSHVNFLVARIQRWHSFRILFWLCFRYFTIVVHNVQKARGLNLTLPIQDRKSNDTTRHWPCALCNPAPLRPFQVHGVLIESQFVWDSKIHTRLSVVCLLLSLPLWACWSRIPNGWLTAPLPYQLHKLRWLQRWWCLEQTISAFTNKLPTFDQVTFYKSSTSALPYYHIPFLECVLTYW